MRIHLSPDFHCGLRYIRFIEDNWHTGRIDGASFDALAGDIQPMVGFKKQVVNPPLIRNTATGEPSGDD